MRWKNSNQRDLSSYLPLSHTFSTNYTRETMNPISENHKVAIILRSTANTNIRNIYRENRRKNLRKYESYQQRGDDQVNKNKPLGELVADLITNGLDPPSGEFRLVSVESAAVHGHHLHQHSVYTALRHFSHHSLSVRLFSSLSIDHTTVWPHSRTKLRSIDLSEFHIYILNSFYYFRSVP